jgi:hypothetical protein
MKKSVFFAALTTAGIALVSSPAWAECDTKQAEMVGRAIAEKVEGHIPAEERKGDRAIDLDRCEGGSTYFRAKFRYHVERDGQKAWVVEGEANGKDDDIRDLRIVRSAPENPRQYARADTW